MGCVEEITKEIPMSVEISMSELLKAGLHFGHATRSKNQNGSIHIRGKK